jgi:hypothetical protein
MCSCAIKGFLPCFMLAVAHAYVDTVDNEHNNVPTTFTNTPVLLAYSRNELSTTRASSAHRLNVGGLVVVFGRCVCACVWSGSIVRSDRPCRAWQSAHSLYTHAHRPYYVHVGQRCLCMCVWRACRENRVHRLVHWKQFLAKNIRCCLRADTSTRARTHMNTD